MKIHIRSYEVHNIEQALSDCLVDTAFGCREINDVITPSISNEAVTEYAVGHRKKLPAILPYEIAEALTTLGASRDVIRIEEPSEAVTRLDTVNLATQTKAIMGSNGRKRASLVARPNHSPWLDYVCGQAGIETVAPTGLSGVSVDEQSAQYWTRSLADWQSKVSARQRAHEV